ncbi:MAG: DUF58 domain-containing protein [Longimicrobiales bacterium]|nr:DUF58 domain-containing protein [Longimicrobiales bacterium]
MSDGLATLSRDQPSEPAGGAPGRFLDTVVDVLRWPVRAWRRLRAWRRIYFTRGGLLFVIGAFGVGFAAMNTGNNLLFLILGAMLGSIVLSSWLSEQTIRDVEVRRQTPRAAVVGEPARIQYEVKNHKRWIPSLAMEIREAGLPTAAFLPRLDGGDTDVARSEHRFVRRGVYPLDVVTISTSFPFGLFRKERDVELPGELIVWPRSDREVPPVAAEGERGVRRPAGRRGSAGSRGEYRGLREYRPGDDPRAIHWRSTARLGDPVIREFEEDASESVWICLDTRGDDEELVEETVEIAASLAARFQRAGRRFALTTPDREIGPSDGPAQIERTLDALARVEFTPGAPLVSPSVSSRRCVLVSITGRGGHEFGDVVVPDGRGFG